MQRSESDTQRLEGLFTVPGQIAPPNDVQSVTFTRQGLAGTAPIISLNSGQTLELAFDRLSTTSDQFVVELSHHDPDWTESSLLPNDYLSNFFEDTITGGVQSRSQEPQYFHYSYEFPNERFGVKVSGNYLITVRDSDTQEILFSLPFFVHENLGSALTDVQRLFNNQTKYRKAHQPFSRYQVPDQVQLPRLDLNYFYVQNQFWGRAKKVSIIDDNTPGEIRFHLSRDQAFNATYTFYQLDLGDFDVDGVRIREVIEEVTPTGIILFRDVITLSELPQRLLGSRYGEPLSGRGARYANVTFSLNVQRNFNRTSKIYLVGDFNNWSLQERNRVRYNPELNLFRGDALVKQGQYSYKYVAVQNGEVDELALDDVLSNQSQKYTLLIYFSDPNKFYNRLLQIEEFTAN